MATGGGNKNIWGEEMMALGNNRFVFTRVQSKGKAIVDIREYYKFPPDMYDEMDNAAWKPCKMGIALTKEQWQNLKNVIPEIDEKLSK
jgi:hypothetical protein